MTLRVSENTPVKKNQSQLEAEFYISDAKVCLEEKGDKITSELKSQIEDCIKILEQAVKSNEKEKIDTYSNHLLELVANAEISD